MRFEWDKVNRQDNIRKHGIDFVDAALVFEGPTLEKADSRRPLRRDEMARSGQSGSMVLMVIYTLRGETRRIISAWKVNDDGARRYAKLLTR